MRYKIVTKEGWVHILSLMNKRFPGAFRPCRDCAELKCGMVWYNINSKEVLCDCCMKLASKEQLGILRRRE